LKTVDQKWSVSSNLTASANLKESIMPSIQYQDTSMYGSYWVDCEVLEKIDDNTFKIKFWDDVVDEYEIKVVERERLQFPKFNELMVF
jgi:hypothetical protein